jgi:hypothetical protein
MPRQRTRSSVRTLAWERRTRRRREATKPSLEIQPNGVPRAGETFEFIVLSSSQRLARLAVYIDRARLWEVTSIDTPHVQRVFISLRAAGQTLRIRAFDNVGNDIEEQFAILVGGR